MKHLIIALLMVFPACLFAQDKPGDPIIDSLVKVLTTAPQDTNRVNVLNELAVDLVDNDPDQGIKYAQEALKLSQKLNWKPGIALAYFRLASNYQSKSDYAKVLENYLESLKLFEQLGDKNHVCGALGNIGIMYYSMKKYEDALRYDSMALDIARATGNIAAIARNTGNMGTIYDYMGNPEKALVYLNLALKSNEQRNYKRGMATNLSNIAGVYFTQKKFRLALDHHLSALAIYKETDNRAGMAMSMGNVGAVYVQLVKDSTLNTKPDELISASKKVNLEKGLDYMLQALTLAKEMGDLEEIMELTNNIHQTYKIARNFEAALDFQTRYMALRDSVYSRDNLLQLAALETKREADLKNKQIEINQLQQGKASNERMLYAAVAAVLLLLVWGVYRRYNSQKSIVALQKGSLQQKEMLMREIHHRVKNNLQVISALLDLQLTNVTDDHAKDAITESTTRLKAISLIHHQLYQDKDITTIECTAFTTELHTQINAVFSKPGQQVELHKDMPVLPLDIDTAVPFGLILNELMTNSYKYAFIDGSKGSMTIKLEAAGDNRYRLSYRDSGPGLPAGLDITKSKGLGLNIIRSLSKQLGGSFSYDTASRYFVVLFKDMEGRKMTD